MKPTKEFYRELRLKIGSVEYVSGLLQVNKRTIQRRESGETKVTSEMICALEFFKSKGKK